MKIGSKLTAAAFRHPGNLARNLNAIPEANNPADEEGSDRNRAGG